MSEGLRVEREKQEAGHLLSEPKKAITSMKKRKALISGIAEGKDYAVQSG